MVPPILIFAISYIVGVVIADYFNIRLAPSIWFLAVGLIIHLVITYKISLLRIVSAALAFVFIGMFLTSLTISKLDSSLLCKAASRSSYVTVEGILECDPIGKNGIFNFDFKTEKISLDHKEWSTSEKLRIRVRSARQLNLYLGEPVRISGHLKLPRSDGDFNYRRYLYHRGITALLNASTDDIKNLNNAGFSLSYFSGSIRHWIKERNSAYLSGKESSLLNGIVLGDTSSIDEDLEEMFKTTGLTHILAASGINIALVIGALWPLLRLLRFRAGAQVTVLVASAAFYTMISGMSPSINRAFLMAAMMLFAWLLGKEANITSSLATATLVLLIANPFTLYDIGFQLSFAATASLIIFMPPLERLMGDIPKFLSSALSVTLAAQIGVLPIIIYYFGQVSAISLVANLIIVPLVAPALILGMAVLPIEALVSLFARPVYLILALILKAMIYGTILLAKMPGASIFLGQPSMLMVAMIYVVIAASGLYLKRIKLRLSLGHAVLALLAILVVSIWWQVEKSLAPSQLEVIFLDVGQGDSTMLTTPDGTRLLIDSGPDPGIIKRKIQGRGINKIDMLLISHDHSDHIGGARKVLNTVAVGSLVYPKIIKGSKPCVSLLNFAKNKGVKCVPIENGDILRLGKCLEIDILNADVAESNNEESAVVMVKYGKLSLLFTGDAGESTEQRLIHEREGIDADILKVGHHGSAASSTRDFLREVSPKVSIISVGKNNMYGLPARSTIGRLLAAGSKIYRTDRDGDVTIRSDGKTYQVYVEKPVDLWIEPKNK